MRDYLERARLGDPIAINIVTDTLRPRLASMAAHYARRCGEDPDDLLQEAWAGLLEALPTLDTAIGDPEQYLIRIARWRVLDAIKRARVRRCAALDDVAESSCDHGDDTIAAADAAAFLIRLKATQRTILACLLAGYTWREAGAMLGCSSANIAYHVRQIRSQYESWTMG